MSERIPIKFQSKPRETSERVMSFHHTNGSRLVETGNAVHDMGAKILQEGSILIMGVVLDRGKHIEAGFQIVSSREDEPDTSSEMYSEAIIHAALDILIAQNVDREEIDDALRNLKAGEAVLIPINVT